MKSSRFQLVLFYYLLFLSLFFLTRVFLLFASWDGADPTLSTLLEIGFTGVLFDSGFFAYAMIFPILYLWFVPQKIWRSRWHGYWLNLVLFVTLYAACFISVAEYLFWDEFSVRFNFISIDYLIYRREVTDNIVQSYPIFLLFSGMFVVALALYLVLRSRIQPALESHESFFRRSLIALLLLLLPLTAVFALGQSQRDISENSYVDELGSNGPYQFFAAFRNNELDFKQFYAHLPDQEADQLIRTELSGERVRFLSEKPFDIRREISNPGEEKALNVVLVTIESLSSDFIGYFGNERNLTPNLDALVDNSLFFDNFYATGTRTTRGLEAITLSIPPTPGRSIIKRLGRETDQWSLGAVLNEKGYQSYFMYGGRGYFENMSAFFSGNGYQIVDQSSVPAEEISFENAWGMADDDLYKQAIKIADRESDQGRPFFFHLMTTTNHRPYTYPEGRIDIPSGTGRDGAIKYTDYAIGELLRTAAEKPWFNDTLFVFIADHQAGSAGKSALPLQRYHIPLWIYAPGHIAPKIVNELSSQIDLAPTLLGLLNMSYRSCFFGQDLLRNPPHRALIANYQNLGLFDGREMAILEPRQQIVVQQGFGDGEISETPSQASDPLVKRNIGYYQSAAAVYGSKINAWSTRDVVPLVSPVDEPRIEKN